MNGIHKKVLKHEKKHLFEHTEIEYEWTKKKIKNLNLRVKKDGTVVASSPWFVTPSEMDRFVTLHASYILSAQKKWETMQKMCEKEQEEEQPFIWILGEKHALTIEVAPKNHAMMTPNGLLLRLKDTKNEILKKKTLDCFLSKICREQAEYFCEKLYPTFQEHCPCYPSLSYRSMKSRWGSCNPSQGKILLNKRLAQVPPTCIEYVVCHELTHFIHPNHSTMFYTAMNENMPDWKERKKMLTSFEALLRF